MRQYGKRIKQLSKYISQVAQGKHAMIMGDDYVVLSRKTYDAWVKKLTDSTWDNLLDNIDDILIDGEAEKDREWEAQKRKR